jgi:alkylation response protein AidB-like acyl-CoA dehydrogenase
MGADLLGAEAAAALAGVERYARRHLDLAAARRIDAERRVPPPVLAALAELGLFGLTFPEEHGGAGLGLAGACLAAQLLARHDRAVATTVGLHLGLGTRGLVAFGSDAQKERWLPALAAGRRIAAFATTEAGAGSDLTAIATTARPTADGRLRVDGAKIYVTNGGLAGLFTISAATPGMGGARRGRSLILLEREDAGVTVGPEEHKLGLRGSSTTGLVLDGVEVPADRLLGEGEGGDGDAQLAYILAWGRTVMAAGCAGAAEAALALTREHVDTRRQFGKPLRALEVVKEQLATMAATAFAMEALVAECCEADAAGERERLAFLSSAAKVLCSEGDWEICDRATQLHGGLGYIEESGVPLLLRDARITRIFEGANDVILGRLGLMEVTRPGLGCAAMAELPAAALAVARRVDDACAEEIARHGARLLGKARLLHRLGRLVVWREATLAAAAAAAVAALVAAPPMSDAAVAGVTDDLHDRSCT